MVTDPDDLDNDDLESHRERGGGLIGDRIEIDVHDPTITDEFDEAEFDHEFDDDFEEEIEGEYELEDDKYGEDFHKEFGHLTDEDEDDVEFDDED
jgi:hypothetical protein